MVIIKLRALHGLNSSFSEVRGGGGVSYTFISLVYK